MIVDRTPESRTLARSVFRLTREETVDAIADYVRKNTGAPLPKGKRFVWVTHEQLPFEQSWVVALGIDEHSATDATEPQNA